jgi:quercetin dioxygenase-like cupin family protein
MIVPGKYTLESWGHPYEYKPGSILRMAPDSNHEHKEVSWVDIGIVVISSKPRVPYAPRANLTRSGKRKKIVVVVGRHLPFEAFF